MRKIKLDVHDLDVETFHTSLKLPAIGTVRALETALQTGVCYSCVDTCIETCGDTCNNSLDYCTCGCAPTGQCTGAACGIPSQQVTCRCH